MIPEARFSRLVRGPIRYAVGALENLACGGIGRGKLWPSQVADFCGDNTAVIWYRLVCYGVHVDYYRTYLQWQQGVSHLRTCGGALEGHNYQHWPVPGRLQRVELFYARVQSMDMNWDGQLRGQTPPKYCGHAEGGPIWYICVYPQGLWCTRLGARPGNNGRVWVGDPGLPTPDPILISGNHGGKGYWIIQIPLSGLPGVTQWGYNLNPNHKYSGGRNHPPLVWSNGRERGYTWWIWVHGCKWYDSILRILRSCWLHQSGVAAVDIWHTNWPLWVVWYYK